MHPIKIATHQITLDVKINALYKFGDLTMSHQDNIYNVEEEISERGIIVYVDDLMLEALSVSQHA